MAAKAAVAAGDTLTFLTSKGFNDVRKDQEHEVIKSEYDLDWIIKMEKEHGASKTLINLKTNTEAAADQEGDEDKSKKLIESSFYCSQDEVCKESDLIRMAETMARLQKQNTSQYFDVNVNGDIKRIHFNSVE